MPQPFTDILEKAINHLAEDGFFVWEHFIIDQEVNELIEVVQNDKASGEFKKSGIGKKLLHQVDSSIRGDYIQWIDSRHESQAVQQFIDKIEGLKSYLNQTCYLGLKDFELHFAIYPPNTFYKKHVDRFQHNSHRILSFVLYLNKNWQQGDGGELGLYTKKSDHVITPLAGKLVLFRSELLHEVLLAHKERMSLTGWMLDKDITLAFLP